MCVSAFPLGEPDENRGRKILSPRIYSPHNIGIPNIAAIHSFSWRWNISKNVCPSQNSIFNQQTRHRGHIIWLIWLRNYWHRGHIIWLTELNIEILTWRSHKPTFAICWTRIRSWHYCGLIGSPSKMTTGTGTFVNVIYKDLLVELIYELKLISQFSDFCVVN